MQRRTFLKSAAAGGLIASGGLAAPSLALAADSRTLRFVPQADLANLDPIWGTLYVVRNASLLIWETLYSVDETLTPQPQMAEGHTVSPDFKTWTFTSAPA
jgi:peptide/nickel transport system substrate-binding protein